MGNILQTWGLIRGAIIALGGAAIGAGILGMTTEQLNALMGQVTAVITAISGLVAVAWPMYQGWKSRSRKEIISAAADQPGVQMIVTDRPTAAVIPSPKVVGPSGV